jgi:hypothetical protein
MRKAWPTIRILLTGIGIVAGSLLLLALLLFAVAFLINWRDEPLTAQTLALLQLPAPDSSRPEDNIYVALQGFDAPPGQSVTAVGQARIERYNQSMDALLHDPTPAKLAALQARDPQRLDFKGDVTFLQPLVGSVWSTAPRHQPQIEQLLADNSELYQRYLALIALRTYRETARPSDQAPFAMTPTQVRKLFLAAIALHVRSGFAHERALALADLESDVQLWRAVLTADGELLWKMLSVANLESDYLLLADLIADGQVVLPPQETADTLVPLFDLREWDIGTAFPAEFRIICSFLRRSDLSATAFSRARPGRGDLHGWLSGAENRVSGHFLKLSATENLLARQTTRQMLAAADPAKFYAARATAGWLPDNQSVWTLPFSYNPIGKILVAVATPMYDSYPPRAWDGAALQRLVRAGYEIRRQRIAPDAIPAFLRQHPDWSTHPASGHPFLWDAASGELRVPILAQEPPGRRFSIHVWQALARPAVPR